MTRQFPASFNAHIRQNDFAKFQKVTNQIISEITRVEIPVVYRCLIKNLPPVPMSQETNVTWPGLMESSQ